MLKKIRAFIHRKNKDYCARCGKKLKEDELECYGILCEKCERALYSKLSN